MELDQIELARVLRFVRANPGPAVAVNGPPFSSLQLVEGLGLITMLELQQAGGDPSLHVSLTALGKYELDRLNGLEDLHE